MISAARGKKLLSQSASVAVLGDLMVDEYLWGKVGRISPEAPVPVVEITNERILPGGSANVAKNLVGLGHKVSVLGVVGADETGKELMELLKGEQIDIRGVVVDKSRPTTVKTRIIGGSQHLARVDKENKIDISPEIENKIISALYEIVSFIDVLLIEDYNKGVLTPKIIEEAVSLCKEQNVIVTVDPKFNNFFAYKGVTLFKPNKKEAEDILGYALIEEKDVEKAGIELMEKLQAENILITLGSRGMALFSRNDQPFFIPTRAIDVADVSGAGDTVISTVSSVLANGGTPREAVTLANIAAGIVCGYVGVVAITAQEIIEVLNTTDEN